MRIPFAALVALLVGACAGTQVPRATQQDAAGTRPSPAATAVRDFVQLLNDERRKAGCVALAWHDGAASVAAAHSADMQRRGYFSHDAPGGGGPFDRIRAAGIVYAAAAENIGQGRATGMEAMEMWMNSPAHRRNMLNCTYTHHGVGIAGLFWTHVLIAPR